MYVYVYIYIYRERDTYTHTYNHILKLLMILTGMIIVMVSIVMIMNMILILIIVMNKVLGSSLVGRALRRLPLPPELVFGKAPQGNEGGATGSKSPPWILEPLFYLCSAWCQEPRFHSKTPFPLRRCFVGRRLGLAGRGLRGAPALPGWRREGQTSGRLRKGGWYGWKPSASSNFSIRAFRAYPLIELKANSSLSSNSRQRYLSQQYPPPHGKAARCTATRMPAKTNKLTIMQIN